MSSLPLSSAVWTLHTKGRWLSQSCTGALSKPVFQHGSQRRCNYCTWPAWPLDAFPNTARSTWNLFPNKSKPSFFSLQYLGHITGDLHSSGGKRKEIVIYLFVKQKVCLSAGLAKLIFTMHRLAKITSAMRNTRGSLESRNSRWKRVYLNENAKIFLHKYSWPQYVIFISFHQKEINQYGNDSSWDT